MEEIREIYNREIYDPFLEYCELHHYHTMQDLVRFPFGPLAMSQELSPSLLNRVKTTFYMYCKKHPEMLGKAAGKPSVDTQKIGPQLEYYFQQNAARLIHISDLVKAMGSQFKRADILTTLEHSPWCKVVDKNTFFYSPES